MICDLCHEYSVSQTHCDECGHLIRARPTPPPQQVPPPWPPRGRKPFGAATAPWRARHRRVLVALGEWSLAAGRSYDADVAALCLDVLEEHRGDDGIRVNRRDVTHLMQGGLRNRTSIADTTLPEGWVSELWTVLEFLIDTGRLDPASDPASALFEPLQCYGGLDAHGRPRPDGVVDVEFPCQCFFPHDPDCPPGLALHQVGRDWDDGTEFVVHANVRSRSEDIPMSAFRPLAKLARRLRARNSFFIVALDQFLHVGTIPATRRTPQLWIYRFGPEMRRGFDPLVLDEHGNAFLAKRNRSYKAGFRWKPIDDRQAVGVCGLVSWAFRCPEPGAWVPDDDDPDVGDGPTGVLVVPPA